MGKKKKDNFWIEIILWILGVGVIISLVLRGFGVI
jgi:hypothetical protein